MDSINIYKYEEPRKESDEIKETDTTIRPVEKITRTFLVCTSKRRIVFELPENSIVIETKNSICFRFTYLDSDKINIITHGKYINDSELISESSSNDSMLFVAMKPDYSIIKQLIICESKSITIKIYPNMMWKTVVDLIKDHKLVWRFIEH